MMFFGVLAAALLVAWLLPARLGGRSVKTAGRLAMGVAFIFAGVAHIAMPDMMLAYFPSWTPYPEALNFGTGIAEILGGLALLAPSDRVHQRAGVLLALYLVLVLPANVYVAVADVDVSGVPDVWWYSWARLPFQALFVWWVLRSTSPERGRSGRSPSTRQLQPVEVR